MGKLMLLAAGAAGYVLGTRAGRERFEQIKAGAGKVAKDPRVRAKAREAGDLVRENAPVVKNKVTDAAAHAKETVREKTSSDDDSAETTGVGATNGSAYPSP